MANKMEHTLGIIKPDAVAQGHTGDIISMLEKQGFTIDRMEKGLIGKEYAAMFYDVHKDKPFFNELVDHISSGPIVVMALRKENAIADWRKLMGSTNPAGAEEGTIRKKFGTNIGKNAVHGSDSPETAARELMIFFGGEQHKESKDDSCACGCTQEGDECPEGKGCEDCPCCHDCSGCHRK